MNNELTKQLFRFLLLLALQVLICNHICLFGFMSPDIYLLALMLLPLTLSKSVQYIIAFATGLIVDLFALTYGIHALASLLMITLRPWIIILLSINKKKMDENVPSPKNRDCHVCRGFWHLSAGIVHLCLDGRLQRGAPFVRPATCVHRTDREQHHLLHCSTHSGRTESCP